MPEDAEASATCGDDGAEVSFRTNDAAADAEGVAVADCLPAGLLADAEDLCAAARVRDEQAVVAEQVAFRAA